MSNEMVVLKVESIFHIRLVNASIWRQHKNEFMKKRQCLFQSEFVGNNIGYDDMRWHFPN